MVELEEIGREHRGKRGRNRRGRKAWRRRNSEGEVEQKETGGKGDDRGREGEHIHERVRDLGVNFWEFGLKFELKRGNLI